MDHDLVPSPRRPSDYYYRTYGEPWSKRKRRTPLQTWSGKVIYGRPTHYFTVKDINRIQKKVIEAWEFEKPDASALDIAISISMEMFIKALDILSWIDPWGITKELQKQAQQVIWKLIGIDNERWSPSIVMDIIQLVASKTDRFEVTFKWRP